ncbi:hypothetical protein [Sagittula salina]|uniref:TNase-like domain-containing protein n=1 Tax=Sagittula salina TaxID=2820268 RepID=A0A940S2L2_9RHOB|nr:hypothetical protein [Sagittula salina]MBP0484206.1 hypothetical protein [Sagittula salina]
MLNFLKIVGVLVLAPMAVQADVASSGPARMLDGGRIEVGGTVFRLHGVTGVARGAVCGQGRWAWGCGAWLGAELHARYEGRILDCFELFRDSKGMVVGFCLDGGADLGRELVRSGLAYGAEAGAYAQEARRAARMRAGIYALGDRPHLAAGQDSATRRAYWRK